MKKQEKETKHEVNEGYGGVDPYDYPDILKTRYGLDNFNLDDIIEIYEKLALKMGTYLKNKEIDYDKINNIIINDIKNEYIKGITFDRRT